MKQTAICQPLWLAAVLVILLCACAKSPPAPAWQEQYDLGVRYLSEGNYQEAIIAFTAAIEIDPMQPALYVERAAVYIKLEEQLDLAQADLEKALELDEANVDAYLGLADVYIRRFDFDRAGEILALGLEKTGDERIAEKLEELQSGATVTDSDGNTRIRRHYNAAGELMSYTLSLGVQEDGKRRTEVYGGASGELDEIHINYESDDGLTSYFERYTADGSPVSTAVAVSDPDGVWETRTLTSHRTGEVTVTRYENVFDERGGKIGTNAYEDGELTHYMRVVDGRTVVYSPDGSIRSYAE